MTGDPIPRGRCCSYPSTLSCSPAWTSARPPTTSAAQQHLGELAELIEALGGTLQDQSAVLIRLDDLAQRIPGRPRRTRMTAASRRLTSRGRRRGGGS